jgi:hypothetical protein
MHTKFSLENPEGKIPFGRPRRIWKDKIRMDLK